MNNMNYTMLSDVDVKETLLDTDHILGVDEYGDIVKTPKSTLSKVKTVNNIEPDENGNITVETGGIKTINGIVPDEAGNVNVDVGVGGVKSVNSIKPDENGNVDITVNGLAPDENGNIEIEVAAGAGGNPVLADVGKETSVITEEICSLNLTDTLTVFNPRLDDFYLVGKNRRYDILFDGKHYTCISKTKIVGEDPFANYDYVGNLSLYSENSEDDTGEPFLVRQAYPEDGSDTGSIRTYIYAPAGSHTLKRVRVLQSVNKIPEKYGIAAELMEVGNVFTIDHYASGRAAAFYFDFEGDFIDLIDDNPESLFHKTVAHVVFDGISYLCDIITDGYKSFYIGNLSLLDENGADTGEPFVYKYDCPDGYNQTYILKAAKDGQHHIEIVPGDFKFKKIPEKYINAISGEMIEYTDLDHISVYELYDKLLAGQLIEIRRKMPDGSVIFYRPSGCTTFTEDYYWGEDTPAIVFSATYAPAVVDVNGSELNFSVGEVKTEHLILTQYFGWFENEGSYKEDE